MQKHEMTKGTLKFLHTELDVAMTFALIARMAKYQDKVVRNTANAQKALQSAALFHGQSFPF